LLKLYELIFIFDRAMYLRVMWQHRLHYCVFDISWECNFTLHSW